ncbi:MAG TPA: hypothetical protein VNQ99_13000 [Xanthobacteraceae bacterium]|nr:hypothetical protein [Xanthobacteraceae bacterium]
MQAQAGHPDEKDTGSQSCFSKRPEDDRRSFVGNRLLREGSCHHGELSRSKTHLRCAFEGDSYVARNIALLREGA